MYHDDSWRINVISGPIKYKDEKVVETGTKVAETGKKVVESAEKCYGNI